MSGPFVSQVETGIRSASFELLQGLAVAGVSTDWLLTGEGPMLKMDRAREGETPDPVNPAMDFWTSNSATAVTRCPRIGLFYGRHTANIMGPEGDGQTEADPRLAELVDAVFTWWQKATDDERAWLKIHLRNTVPGFDKPPKT